MRPGAGLTVHGFRSSFTDWAAEMGYPRDVVRAALSHAVRDATEAAYLRTDHFDARRPLMAAWADFCFGRKPAGITRKISLAEVGPKVLAQRARRLMLAWEAHCFGAKRAQTLPPKWGNEKIQRVALDSASGIHVTAPSGPVGVG